MLLVAKAVIGEVTTDLRAEKLPTSEDDASILSTVTAESLLSRPAVRAWLRDQYQALPKGLVMTFLETSSLLAGILESGRKADPTRDHAELIANDKEAGWILTALSHMDARDAQDSVEMLLMDELNLRSHALRYPLARTVVTLLGPHALTWLASSSEEGHGKLQIHEFSRMNWYRIWEIENQVAVERELIGLSGDDEHRAKAVVALAWTLVALASLVPDAVFLGEYGSRILSRRRTNKGYNFTTGRGKESCVLVSFSKAKVASLIEMLQVAVINPLISAADLMWIAAAMVQEREVSVRFVEPERVAMGGFELFLSHRGLDAKRQLVHNVKGLPATRSVFLDCLTMPRGVINRDFIFGSLVRSKLIAIVDTENYDNSEWCQKERWFAKALAEQGLVRIVHCKLDNLADVLRNTADGSQSLPSDAGNRYPILPRVLFDVDYWVRKPNFHSLKESGHPIDALLPIQTALTTPSEDMGAAIRQTFVNVLATSADGTPFDLWAAALQYVVAAFGISAQARSKDEVRRSIDQLIVLAQAFVESGLQYSPTFRENGPAYLSLLAASTTIQLGGFERELPMARTISEAVAGAAILHDGILLMDARPPGEKRDFRLRLAVEMARANIGSVGIVQNATDEVHQTFVGDLPVGVLPCVTLHSGMDDMFSIT